MSGQQMTEFHGFSPKLIAIKTMASTKGKIFNDPSL